MGAPRPVIEAYFRELQARAEYLRELHAGDHPNEALCLCCCYIDAIGEGYYQDVTDDHGQRRTPTEYSFFRILRDHSGDDLFHHIHPKQMLFGLAAFDQGIFDRCEAALCGLLEGEHVDLMTEVEMRTLLTPLVEPRDREKLARNIWRGAMATVVYEQIRGTLVHRIVGPDGISFDRTRFRDRSPLRISFIELHPCLLRIIAAVAGESLVKGDILVRPVTFERQEEDGQTENTREQ